MNGHALIGAAVLVTAARASSLAVSGILATSDSAAPDIITQTGVFAVAIAIGYFMLRRGDTREKQLADLNAKALADQMQQAHADLAAMRNEMAILRGEYMQTRDKLIEALAASSEAAKRETAHLAELVELRILAGRPAQ